MVDRYVHGYLAPSQDGCHKFVQESVVEVPGGAANAERSISGWKATVSLYGFALNDCPVKTRYVEGDKVVFRADDDEPPMCGLNYDWCRRDALEMVQCAGGVLLSDYDKGFLTPEFIREVAQLCYDRKIPCVADCKRAPDVYAGCVLKGNAEWSSKTKVNLLTDKMVLTYGSDVPTVSGRSVEPSNLLPVKCVNHVGAGDCFAAHLTLALAYGFSLKEAAGLAHSAGRVYVQHPDNRPPLPAEIAADMSTAT